MVGAGGIGCELLKTLVLSGFEDIEMIDLDTIDVSNLNRQFLFRKRHVGMSKAKVSLLPDPRSPRANLFKTIEKVPTSSTNLSPPHVPHQVARETVLKFRPDARIVAHHGNVKDTDFDVDFIRSFHVVLNGLDNLEARKHVNRLCLAAEVPLVESGTTGYLGQVTTHVRGTTACFECNPKPVPKSHPICTLRDTPDKPIHCVVYAADLLFPRLFSNDPNAKSDLDEEDAVELSAFTATPGESPAEFAVRVYDYVFRTKIERLLTKEEMWANEQRKKPTPLPQFTDLVPEGATDAARGSDAAWQTTACKALGLSDAHATWTDADAARVFVSSASRIMARDEANGSNGTDTFDKDDALACEFVAATAALRSANYGIERRSLFDAKGMAGNIVHAVATTNAIVGGLIVIEALKVLREQGLKAKGPGDAADSVGNGVATPVPCAPCPYRYTFVKQHKSNSRLLEPIDPDPPNPHCVVCGSARVTLVCDVESMTLGKLIEDVLKKKLGMNAPEVNAPKTILYEQDDGLDDDEIEQYTKNCASTLVNLPAGGVRHDTTLTVTDFSQKFDFELVIKHVPKEEWDEETDPDGYVLRGDKVAAADVEENGAGDTNGVVAEDVDDCLIVDDEDEVKAANVAAGTKLKRDDDDDDRDAKEIRIE